MLVFSRTQENQVFSSASIFSSLFSTPISWLSRINQQVGVWYDTAHSYLTDELRVFSPEPYLPEDIQTVLQIEWKQQILTDQLKQDQDLTLKQFRLAIYAGLMQIINNEVEPQAWINQLERYESFIPENLYTELMSEVANFNRKYFMPVEQHAYNMYEVPASAYQTLFNRIEMGITTAEEYTPAKAGAPLNDVQNNKTKTSVLNSSRRIFHWAYENPGQALTLALGFAATADFFQSRLCATENTFAPVSWLSRVTVVYGTQQVFTSRILEMPDARWRALPVLASLLTPAFAQVNNTFVEILDGNEQYAYAIQIASDGGLVMAGATATYTNGAAVLLAKWDSNGTLAWMKTLGGINSDAGYALQITSDGGLVVAGNTNSFAAGQNFDVLLAKWYGNGTLAWAKALGGNATYDFGYALQETSDGSLIVAGSTGPANNDMVNNVLLAKWYGNGTLAWAQTLGEGGEVGYALQTTSDGGLVVAGTTTSFGAGSNDVLLAKWYGNGTLAWAQAFGGSGQDLAYGLQVTSDGSLVVAGTTNSFNASDSNVLLAKWYGNGTLAWAQTLEGNVVLGSPLLATSDGELVIAGEAASGGMLLAKFYSNGALVWAKTLGGDNNTFTGTAIQETSDGSLVVAGYPSNGVQNTLLTKWTDLGEILNCSLTADITSNVGVNNTQGVLMITNINPSASSLNVTAQSWNITDTLEFPSQQQYCFEQFIPPTTMAFTTTPATTMALTTTTAHFTTQTSTSNPPTASSPHTNASIGTGPLIGLVAGAVGVGATTVGALAYLLWRQKQKERNRVMVATNEQSSHNPDTANNSLDIELQPIRVNKGRTVISGKYELINKITKEEAEELLKQEGIQVTFEEGKNKARFTLGRGQFGKLRLAREIKTDRFVGVKKIKGEREIKGSVDEAKVQFMLKEQPCIMQLLDSIETVGSENQPVLYQFMPLAGFGNGDVVALYLSHLQDKSEKETLLVHIAKSLLTAFTRMHAMGIYHLDFKPANMVLDIRRNVYVIDFGCALLLQKENPVLAGGSGDMRYYSPERLANFRHLLRINAGGMETVECYDAVKVDAWALGLTLLQLATGVYPFNDANRKERVEQWNIAYFSHCLAKQSVLKDPEKGSYFALVKALLDPNPQTRLSIEKAREWPIFENTEILLKEESWKEETSEASLKEFTLNSDYSPLPAQEKEHYGAIPVIAPYEKTSEIMIDENDKEETQSSSVHLHGAFFKSVPQTSGRNDNENNNSNNSNIQGERREKLEIYLHHKIAL